MGVLPRASAVAEGVSGQDVIQHKWQPAHNPWPLWFIKRVSEVGASNCSIQEVDVRIVTTFDHSAGGKEAFADNCDVMLPLLVNTKALAQGEELRVYWPAQMLVKQQKKKCHTTWEDTARVAVVKQHHRRSLANTANQHG